MKNSQKKCLEFIQEYKDQCLKMALEKDPEKRNYIDDDSLLTLSFINICLGNYLDYNQVNAFASRYRLFSIIKKSLYLEKEKIFAILVEKCDLNIKV